ncbi:MAG: pirin family protein [Bacteroidota bacterium]
MKKLRTIDKITYAHEFQMGNMRVKQPLPTHELEQVSPFILLHHAGPDHYKAGEYKNRLGPHPHRGFEPVTFIFNGKVHHRDSMGNEGFLQTGDVQWMTAGKGVIHSEGPSEKFSEEGGTIEIIQLWINLPREHKMTEPKYQDIPSSKIPVIENEKVKMKLVSGNYSNLKGPADTFTNILSMMIEFEEGAEINLDVPENFNSLIYLLDGKLESGSETINKLNMIAYNNDGNSIQLKSISSGKLLFLSGEPINEPMVNYGPFVMNYPGEIKQAILDYEQGKMGSLDF